MQPLCTLMPDATYFGGQQQIVGVAHEAIVLLGGHGQASGLIAEEGEIEEYQGMPHAALLQQGQVAGTLEGDKRVLHVLQLA